MKRELTQFSRMELASSGIIGAPAEELQQKLSAPDLKWKTRAMYVFELALRESAEQMRIERLGGLGNIQRIRVFKDDADNLTFEYTTALPPAVLAQKAREAARKEEMEKKAAELVAHAALALVVAAATSPKPKRAPKKDVKRKDAENRKKFLLSKDGEKAAFDVAWRQRQHKLKTHEEMKPVPVVEKVKRLPQFRGL